MAPVLRPSIRSFEFFEGVTERVVPGQTRTSPPRDNRSTAVSLPAVRDDPAAKRLPASTTSPTPLVTGTAAGSVSGASDTSFGGWTGGFLAAFGSSGGFSLTVKRFPAMSHV